MATQIKITASIIAPIEKVWDKWTNPEHITKWNFAVDEWQCPRAENDLKVGGKYFARMEAKDGSFGFDFAGTYTRVVPNELIEYAFGDRVGLVEFITGENGVTVRVSFDAETTHPEAQQRQGWQAILDNFARHVEARV